MAYKLRSLCQEADFVVLANFSNGLLSWTVNPDRLCNSESQNLIMLKKDLRIIVLNALKKLFKKCFSIYLFKRCLFFPSKTNSKI